MNVDGDKIFRAGFGIFKAIYIGAAIAMLAILATIFCTMAHAADYCIGPSGGQTSLSNCQADGTADCTSAISNQSANACTLATAVSNLTAGNRALLLGGDYGSTLASGSIKPVNSGTSDTNRVTFQAYGDSPMITHHRMAGADNDDGTFTINQKNYVTISGKSAINPADATRYIQMRPTSTSGTQIIICESVGSIVEYTDVRCDTKSTACDRLAALCRIGAPIDSKYNIFRNNYWKGQGERLVGESKTVSTDENFIANGRQYYNLMEDNTIIDGEHTALNVADPEVGLWVFRGNLITNDNHTVFSAYKTGMDSLNGDAQFLIEDNVFIGSGIATDSADPDMLPRVGAVWQNSLSDSVYRYNVVTLGNSIITSLAGDTSVEMQAGTFGCASDVQQYKFARNAQYNNSFVRSGGRWSSEQTIFACSPVTIGEEYGYKIMTNNILFDVYMRASGSNQLSINYAPASPNGQNDIWRRNVFGVTGGSASSTPFLKANGVNNQSFNDAITNTAHPGPVFGGFSEARYANIYRNDLGNDFVTWPAATNDPWDFDLKPTSALINAGAPLTSITGVNSASSFDVAESRVFFGEAKSFATLAPWMGVEQERICIGPDPTDMTASQRGCAQIDTVTDGGVTVNAGSIALKSVISGVQVGDYVWVTHDSRGVSRVSGSAPDIGAFEFSSTDTTPPSLAEVTEVPTPDTDTTPSWTFSTNEACTINYSGDCSSATTSATPTNNTVIFNALSVGTHSNCSITCTDAADNESSSLSVTTFEITSGSNTVPSIAFGSPVPTPTVDRTPGTILNITDDDDTSFTVIAGGSCIVLPTTLAVGSNAIEFHNPPSGGSLAEGSYTDCTIQVSDGTDTSNTLNPSFVIDITPPVVTYWRPKGEPLDAGTTGVNISITASDAVSMTGGGGCRWSNTDQAYDSMENNFTDQTGDLWDDDLTGLEDGTAYHHYARCRDEAGNRHQASYDITYSVQSSGGAPTISNPSPIANLARAANVATISLDTNITATCRYGLSKETWGTMTEMVTTAGTSHSQVIPVNAGNVCKYNVLCSDDAGATLSNMQSIYIYAPRGKALPTE